MRKDFASLSEYSLYTEILFSRISYFVSRNCGLFTCAACNRGVYPLCCTCAGQFLFSTPSCAECNQFSEKGLLHSICQTKRLTYVQTISCFEYAKTVKYLLSTYKYKGCYHLFHEIALMIHSYFRLDPFNHIVSCFENYKRARILLLPVPMSRNKYAERGFSPAQELAILLGRYLRDNFACNCYLSQNILVKHSGSVAQAKKSRQQRLLTLSREYSLNAFHVANLIALAPEVVIVVDDVITTGATTIVILDTLSKNQSLRSFLTSIPLLRFSFAKVA